MSLIQQNRIFTTSGNESSFGRAWYNNYWANSTDGYVPLFSQEIPTYRTVGGVEPQDYYNQNPLSIFTGLAKPFIRFEFTGATSALTQIKTIVHKIYKIPYDSFKTFETNQPTTSLEQSLNTSNSNRNATDQTENVLTNSNGTSFVQKNDFNLGGNPNEIVNRPYGKPLSSDEALLLQPQLSTPLVVITASTSGITTNIYDFYPDQVVKQFGSLKQELFEDKSQYFISTEFEFEVERDLQYDEYFRYVYVENVVPIVVLSSVTSVTTFSTSVGSSPPQTTGPIPLSSTTGITSTTISIITTGLTTGYTLSSETWDNTMNFTTEHSPHIIDKGIFTGLEVKGNYFTYFDVPKKPSFLPPLIQGKLDTFSPLFTFGNSNGKDADEYLLQINYNTGDTGFTGTIFNYQIKKTAENTRIGSFTEKGSTTDFNSQQEITTASAPLKSNSDFLYRIGNVRYMLNIFGVRQFVVTFSDAFMATTQTEPVKTFVQVQSDSPHISEVATFTTPESLDTETPLTSYMLSGTVSGSVVSNATLKLTYPNLSYVISTTDSNGNYIFTDLEAGNYILETFYRGYQDNVQPITINGDMVLNYKIRLLWSNAYDTWGQFASENYFVGL
jgi:hypothetical protein